MRYFFWLFLAGLVVVRYLTGQPDYVDGQKIRITGQVSSEPIYYENSQNIKLGGLSFYVDRYPEVNYGDKIVIEGVVKKESLEDARLIGIKENRNGLYVLRQKLIEFYKRSLPEPHASLVAGVTLGSKSSIPPIFFENLRNSGTVHVVVASGMNVTLVASFLMNTLVLFISRRKAILLALVGIWTYSVLSGFDAPIIRAAIMGSLVFSAQKLGRVYDGKRALLMSALTMLIVWPSWAFDLGFILSFLATASILILEGKIRKLLKIIPSVMRLDLSTSLAAQVGVLPVLYISFGQLNLLSPFINVLVLWTIPLITILGMAGGVLGVFFEPLGRIVLWLSYPFASWFVFIVQLFGDIRG